MEDHFTNLGVTETENATQITPVINPERRPIIDIIKEGVNLYGKKVTYNFNPKRKSEDFWEDQLAKVARRINTIDMIKVASGDQKAGFLIDNAYTDILYDWNLVEQAGTENLVVSAAAIGRLSDVSKVESSSFYNRTDEEIREKIHKTKLFVERQAASGSISASSIISYFLEGSNGDLSTAIEDTAIFLKLFARNNLETGEWLGPVDEAKVREKIDRYSAIRDEYLPRGRHFMEDVTQETKYQVADLNTNNLIGAAYQAWNAVATLRILPPRATAKATLVRILKAYSNQGNFKVASIAGVCRQMDELNNYFSTL